MFGLSNAKAIEGLGEGHCEASLRDVCGATSHKVVKWDIKRCSGFRVSASLLSAAILDFLTQERRWRRGSMRRLTDGRNATYRRF